MGVTLLGGLAVPPHGLGIVLRHARAVGVPDAEGPLGFGVALLGVNAEPSYRCGIVATFIRRHGFVKCLFRRNRRAKHSQQRQGDNAAPNQLVFIACL